MARGVKTGGRKKGTPNKTTAALKDAILNAFATVGGEAYLVVVAKKDPRTFCTLLGKVLPTTIEGAPEHEMAVFTDKPLTPEEWTERYCRPEPGVTEH
jgi:hypothetical protein